MTRARLRAVGFCAFAGESGDKAFRFALALARRHRAQLDIFIFPSLPGLPHPRRGRSGELSALKEEEATGIEKRVRLYYDRMLGEYLEVGFRLCPGDEDPELRRCLFDRQYDVLVLAYESEGARFGERSIEDFARSLPCPVVLVGRVRGIDAHLNQPARLWLTELGLEGQEWTLLAPAPDRASR